MSRVARKPVVVPSGVKVEIANGSITVSGKKAALACAFPSRKLEIKQDGSILNFSPKGNDRLANASAGTFRMLVSNMIVGVTSGFEKRLKLVGVGYRAQTQGNTLSLTLGFSHPVTYQAPAGVTFETPTQTDIIVRAADKQAVGQAAADIRAFRPPEPYKGKGVRYADEVVRIKEIKKK